MSRHHYRSAIILLAVLWAGSCAKPVSQDVLIEDAVKLRVAQWRQAQLTDCRDRVIDKADAYVDSVLLANSLQSKLDTIPKPVKPERPEKPPLREKPDTVIIRRQPDADQ